MSLRHLALAAGGVLLLGAGVYLYLEVHAAAGGPAVVVAPEAAAPGERRPGRELDARPAAPVPAPAAAAAAGPSRLRLDRPGMLARGGGAASPPEVAPSPAAEPAPSSTDPNPKLDAVMSEANKAYDRGDFDEASQIAQKVLAREPGNVRMLRVMVSSACQGGDSAVAQRYYAQLPEPDQAQMRVRCERYGVSFDPGRAR